MRSEGGTCERHEWVQLARGRPWPGCPRHPHQPPHRWRCSRTSRSRLSRGLRLSAQPGEVLPAAKQPCSLNREETVSVRPSVPLAQPQRSDSARVPLFSLRAPKSLHWLMATPTQSPAFLPCAPAPPRTLSACVPRPRSPPAGYLSAGSSRSGWRGRPRRCCQWHRRPPGSGRTRCHPPRMRRTVRTESGLRRTPGCGDGAAPAPARPLLRRKLTPQPSAAETKASPRAKG